MGCWSFNLPAGPPALHGTCPAAALGFIYLSPRDLVAAQRAKAALFRVGVDPSLYICSGCYAGKHQYATPSLIFGQALRLELVERLLGIEAGRTRGRRGRVVDARGGGERDVSAFSRFMYEAVEFVAERAAVRRRQLERFGWTVASFREVEARLRGEALPNPRRKLREFYDWQVPHPAYFRIHDAGDFWRDDYLAAWLEVCRRLPRLHFWAPTRAWAVAKRLPVHLLASVPPNLALRPSALHFREPAPGAADMAAAGLAMCTPGVGGGLAAGSGAAPETPKGAWECPAMRSWQKRGGEIIEGKGGTCALARGPRRERGCRVCWTRPEMVVYYHEH